MSKSRNPSLTINLNGEEVILNADGTALFQGKKLMVVSDLHLEKGRALSATALYTSRRGEPWARSTGGSVVFGR
ncbi:MAG: hypothetical protein VW554_04630 [Alphaproteobacteria bacterium]